MQKTWNKVDLPFQARRQAGCPSPPQLRASQPSAASLFTGAGYKLTLSHAGRRAEKGGRGWPGKGAVWPEAGALLWKGAISTGERSP